MENTKHFTNMSVITRHQYIDRYPIRLNDTRLILGTIHPHNVESFSMPFFYGNEGYLWKHLAKAFPCKTFNNVQSVEQILKDNNVWISDIIIQCERNHAGITKDEDLFNIQLNTNEIRDGLTKGKIHTIFFTSAFGCNNTANLFVKAFGIDYRRTYDDIKREFIIPSNHFGREIRGVVMYSPTDGANRGIAKGNHYKRWKTERWNGIGSPMNAFKIAHYQEKMSFLACK